MSVSGFTLEQWTKELVLKAFYDQKGMEAFNACFRWIKKGETQMLIRVLAFLCAILTFACAVAVCILGIVGSPYFLPMLFVCVLLSVLMWAISLIAKLLKNKGEEMAHEEGVNNKNKQDS